MFENKSFILYVHWSYGNRKCLDLHYRIVAFLSKAGFRQIFRLFLWKSNNNDKISKGPKHNSSRHHYVVTMLGRCDALLKYNKNSAPPLMRLKFYEDSPIYPTRRPIWEEWCVILYWINKPINEISTASALFIRMTEDV